MNAMINYPSPSWALLWLELLRDREIPLPVGFLRSTLRMCTARNDLFGLLETLHACRQELVLSKTKGFIFKQEEINNDLELDSCSDMYVNSSGVKSEYNVRFSSPNVSFQDQSYISKETQIEIDSLSKKDWNNACVTAFRSRNSITPLETYKEAFAEVFYIR
jgi:hypothetical protein